MIEPAPARQTFYPQMQTSSMTGFDWIFGENHTFCPAVIGEAGRWLPKHPHGMSGGQLAFFKDTPCLCHAAVASEQGLGHLKEAGHELSSQLLLYRNDGEAIDLLKPQIDQGRKIIINHLPLPQGIPGEALWSDPALVSHLNNKAKLGDWVPGEYLPARRTVAHAELADNEGSLPVVIKVATDGSTGGGTDLLPCHSKEELAAAITYFEGARWVVVEDWLDLDEVWCMNYACCVDGRVFHLGSARQIVDDKLKFHGNLFAEGDEPDESMLQAGHELAQKAAAAGYYGVIGLDAGRDRDGSWYLYDINARMNASTAPLLARRKFPWLAGSPIQRTTRLIGGDSIEDVIRISQRGLADHRFLPLATFDPGTGGLDGVPYITGIITGSDTRDIEHYLTRHLGQPA